MGLNPYTASDDQIHPEWFDEDQEDDAMKTIKTNHDGLAAAQAHTPGPWLRNQYGHVYAMVPDAVFGMAAMGSREVCNLQENPNITADARLIAAGWSRRGETHVHTEDCCDGAYGDAVLTCGQPSAPAEGEAVDGTKLDAPRPA